MQTRRIGFSMRLALLWLVGLASRASRTSGQQSGPAPAPISSIEGAFVEEESELDPFTGIQVCLPYNVVIAPSPGNYSLTIEASLDVLAALSATVTDDTLQLETDGDFVTDQPIKLTVSPDQNQRFLEGPTPCMDMGPCPIATSCFLYIDEYPQGNGRHGHGQRQ